MLTVLNNLREKQGTRAQVHLQDTPTHQLSKGILNIQQLPTSDLPLLRGRSRMFGGGLDLPELITQRTLPLSYCACANVVKIVLDV